MAQPQARTRRGEVVVVSPKHDDDFSGQRGFVATPAGDVTILDPAPGATTSEANGINDAGVVVGNSGGILEGDPAFRYDSATGTMNDLGTLPGYAGRRALAINTADTAVGYAYVPTNLALPSSMACYWPAGAVDAIALHAALPPSDAFLL